MSLFLKWYLRYRYPKYQRAYRLVFDPDGFHHYPNELKAQLNGKTKAEIQESLGKTLHPYIGSGNDRRIQETISQLAEITLALPKILDTTIHLANWESLASKEKKQLIALVAYLVSPVDVIPEGTFGSAGFADDAVCASIAYNAVIAGTSKEFVSAFWKNENDFFEVLCAAGGSAKETLPKLYGEVSKAFYSIFA